MLFAGDTPLIIHRPGDSYHPEFILALEKLVQRDIQAIYFGHGRPLLENCHERLSMSLKISETMNPNILSFVKRGLSSNEA